MLSSNQETIEVVLISEFSSFGFIFLKAALSAKQSSGIFIK